MNSIRYDKLNLMTHLHNQKSHYRKIMEARKHIDFKAMHEVVMPNSVNKGEVLRERERKQNNYRLINNLMDISKKTGLLEQVEIEARRKIKSLKNFQVENVQKKQRIEYDNKKIAERLLESKPLVGTKTGWKTHYKTHRKYQKMRERFEREQTYNPQLYLRETLTSLSKPNKDARRCCSMTNNTDKGIQNVEPQTFHLQLKAIKSENSAVLIKKRKAKKHRINRTVDSQSNIEKQSDYNLKQEINKIILADNLLLFDDNPQPSITD